MALVTPQDPKEWAAEFMTPTEAQAALKRTLVFGDPEQIQARALVEELERTIHAILKCPHSYRRRSELCCCLRGFRPEILEYAAKDTRVALNKPDYIERIYQCLPKPEPT